MESHGWAVCMKQLFPSREPSMPRQAVRPYRHKDSVTQSWSWLTCSPELCCRGTGPAHQYGAEWGLSRDYGQKAEVQYSRVARNIVISLFRLREDLFCSRTCVIRVWDMLSFVCFWRCVWQCLAFQQPVLCWKIQHVCSAIQNSVWETQLWRAARFPPSRAGSQAMSWTDNKQQRWKKWLRPQRTFDSWPVQEHNSEDKSCLVFSYISIKPVVCLKISMGGFNFNDSLS